MQPRSTIGKRVEEVILSFLIILQVLDFLEWIPGDLDYFKKIISWTILGYIFYRVSLTRIFFGVKNKAIDLIIVLSYFLLLLKDFIGYVAVSVHETNYLLEFFEFILQNAVLLETGTFYIGGLLIIGIAIYTAIKIKIKKPSLFSLILKKNKGIKNALPIFIVLVAFFVIVFNLVMEWLAIGIDAPLIVFAILFYLFIIVGRRAHISPEGLLFKIGTYGEEFYTKFIKLFSTKKGILIAMSGLLVLHLLTEIGVFIIPYVLGFRDALYFDSIQHFNQLGNSHSSIYTLFKADWILVHGFLDKLSLIWIYLFNILAMLFLLIGPAFIWYNFYKNKGFYLPKPIMALFFISVICFGLAPVFGIRPINTPGLVGVDIWTKSVLPASISIITLISLIAGTLIYIGEFFTFIKKRIITIAVVMLQLFLALYVVYFFIDTYTYHMGAIKYFSTTNWFFGFFFAIFLIITFCFYAAGFPIFLGETQKEIKRIT